MDATAGTARDFGGAIDIAGFQSITYADLEAVELVNDAKQKDLLKQRQVF